MFGTTLRNDTGVPLVQRIASDQGFADASASIAPGGDLASLTLLGVERAAFVVDFAGHYLRCCHVPEREGQEVVFTYAVEQEGPGTALRYGAAVIRS